MTATAETIQALPLEDLERRIAALGAGLACRMARWLELVAEFDRREAARCAGFRGTAEWLAWRCGIGSRAAREHVRVARRLAQLPLVREAFAGGGLSYSKVRAITRADTAEDEQSLLALAKTCTADRLERGVRALRTAASADIRTANAAHERRTLDWSWELDGALRINGRLGPDDGAAFIEAIETGAEALHERSATAAFRRPPRGARRADALAEIALSGCPHVQVVLHVDAPALACTASTPEDRAGTVCALEHGPAVASETARRLACDGSVILAGGRAGGPADGVADLGRARRVVSPALRASLERRDGGCRFPGCDRRHGLHAHHLTHWAHGGATDRENLVLLCRFHHRLVHEEGFSARLGGGVVRFSRPDGRPIGDLPPPVLAAA